MTFLHRLRLNVPFREPSTSQQHRENLTEIERFANGVLGPWTKYVPTLSGTGGNPSLGDGTLTGQWRELGDLAFVNIHFVYGSTTTTGTGYWQFSLPFAAHQDVTRQNIGGHFSRGDGGHPLGARIDAGEAFTDRVYAAAAGLSATANGLAAAWAAGDTVTLTGFYLVKY